MYCVIEYLSLNVELWKTLYLHLQLLFAFIYISVYVYVGYLDI